MLQRLRTLLPPHRLVTLGLLALLLAFQAQLWIGRGSLPNVQDLQRKLLAQQQINAGLQQTNERLNSELRDLQEGLNAVEERARMELGMVKPGEIFVRYAK